MNIPHQRARTRSLSARSDDVEAKVVHSFGRADKTLTSTQANYTIVHMGESGEISVSPNEGTPTSKSGAEATAEEGRTSVEAVHAVEKEIHQRDNLVVEKKFSPSEKDTCPERSIELTVSQNGQTFRMNDLLPEG